MFGSQRQHTGRCTLFLLGSPSFPEECAISRRISHRPCPPRYGIAVRRSSPAETGHRGTSSALRTVHSRTRFRYPARSCLPSIHLRASTSSIFSAAARTPPMADLNASSRGHTAGGTSSFFARARNGFRDARNVFDRHSDAGHHTGTMTLRNRMSNVWDRRCT
jgi:hypothetical protein